MLSYAEWGVPAELISSFKHTDWHSVPSQFPLPVRLRHVRLRMHHAHASTCMPCLSCQMASCTAVLRGLADPWVCTCMRVCCMSTWLTFPAALSA